MDDGGCEQRAKHNTKYDLRVTNYEFEIKTAKSNRKTHLNTSVRAFQIAIRKSQANDPSYIVRRTSSI